MHPKNALDAPERVGTLIINWSEWETVRPKIKQFKTLSRLTLNDVAIATLPGELADLPALESVDLLIAGDRLPSGMRVFSSVKELGLAARPALKELSDELASFRQLERLRIEHAAFERFPSVVYDLSGLRNLHLLSGRIDQFPGGISKMERLRRIRWTNMVIVALPPDLGKLPALQELELDGIALKQFRVGNGDYTALEQLTLSNCDLSKLPDGLGPLPQLRSLRVSRNPLVEIPAELARTKKLENLAADGCRLERIPDELFSSRALQTIDLTGNTFANDQYNDLERLAKAHPKIKVVMPRKGAKKPAKAISDPPLAESVRKDLDRLGAVAGESEEPIRELDIAGTPWPVPSALGELLSRASLRRAILAPFASDDMNRFGLRFDSSALEEHECIHHHPYVVFADTPTYFFLLLRLDDKKPADPMLYVLDSKDYTANEAQKFDRLSDWLKKARPADGTPPATKKSPRADGASRGATKKRHR